MRIYVQPKQNEPETKIKIKTKLHVKPKQTKPVLVSLLIEGISLLIVSADWTG